MSIASANCIGAELEPVGFDKKVIIGEFDFGGVFNNNNSAAGVIDFQNVGNNIGQLLVIFIEEGDDITDPVGIQAENGGSTGFLEYTIDIDPTSDFTFSQVRAGYQGGIDVTAYTKDISTTGGTPIKTIDRNTLLTQAELDAFGPPASLAIRDNYSIAEAGEPKLIGFLNEFSQRKPVDNVPGPIPFIGAAAAFGYSRKLRRRISCSS